jgi:hypothetical protein
VRDEGERRIAHFAKVQLCGRVWACPVCGPRIRQDRARDVDFACARWIERYGPGSVMLLTLTIPHDRGESLATVLEAVSASFATLVAGRRWQEDKARYSVSHYVRAHDCTVGEHGWHFHIHVVLLATRALSAEELQGLGDSLFGRWAHAVERLGRRPPSRLHGLQLEQAHCHQAVSDYVFQVVSGDGARSKPVALEVARGDLKSSRHDGHRTPWEVLADFAETGDLEDLALWHEWERATAGVHAIRWSKGLRRETGLAAEYTDDEIVQVEIGGEIIYTFQGDEWAAVCATRGAQAMLLTAAEQGGTLAVVRCLQSLLASRPGHTIVRLGVG